MQQHINEAREEGALSRWSVMSGQQRAHFVDESSELVSGGEMPLPSTTWMHSTARLDASQRKLLADYFQSLPEAQVEWRRRRLTGMASRSCSFASVIRNSAKSYLELRDCTEHEGIEQRHGEGCVAMTWTPNHSLVDEAGAPRSKRGHLHIELFGDVTGAVWAWT